MSVTVLPTYAIESYRNAAGRSRKLIYQYARGWHMVLIEMPAVEQCFPTRHRFRTREDARRCWREQRIKMAADGYERGQV